MYKFCVVALLLVASVSSFDEDSWYKKFLPAGYNKEEAPLYNNQPFYTNVSMYYIQLHNFDAYHMQVKADLYMRYLWKDYRLEKKNEKTDKYSYDIPMPEGMKYFYVPDIFVANAVEFKKSEGPNAFMKYYPAEGHLFYSQKIQVTLPCNSQIQYFPFDSIKCQMNLESYGLTAKSMLLRWKGEPTYNEKIIEETSYELYLKNFEHELSSKTLQTGTYETLTSTFIFKRNFGYYMKALFMPNMVYLFISYMAFFVNVKDLFARLNLSFISFFGYMMTHYLTQTSMPMISVNTPLDFFNGIVFSFLFFTILESIMVYKFFKMNEMEEKPEGFRFYMLRVATGADRFFRFLYPIVFTLFITIYSAVCFS